MKLAVLFSGNIESALTVSKAKEEGHEIRYLAVVHSKDLDDHVFHTPNLGLTLMQAEVMKIDLVSKEASNEEDLKTLLKGLEVEGVACGVIENKTKKQMIERVCKELNLKFLTPLWKMKQEKLIKEISSYEAIITAFRGSEESWLGRKIDEKCIEDLAKLDKRGIILLGESGEYESLVLDCPLFERKILITQAEKIRKDNIGILEVKDAKIIEKS